jgi:uncharacterized protein (TIGR02452 family)
MRDPREIRRDAAAAMGAEAVRICHEGGYVAPSGRRVELRDAVDEAIADTVPVPPNQRLDTCPVGQKKTRVEVREESTLVAARRLHAAGLDPVALNFASAHNPGGGFLSGARAQEESLCRASALYVCIKGQPMYAHHAGARDPMYSHYMLYSPNVPVFRDDDGPLLDEPWRCAFITAAAPNVKALRDHGPERAREVPAVLGERVARVLAVAAREGHASVVLGAWGCGAFGGDARLVADTFGAALDGPFRGTFTSVVFAVLDTSADRRTIGPFERRFAAR